MRRRDVACVASRASKRARTGRGAIALVLPPARTALLQRHVSNHAVEVSRTIASACRGAYAAAIHSMNFRSCSRKRRVRGTIRPAGLFHPDDRPVAPALATRRPLLVRTGARSASTRVAARPREREPGALASRRGSGRRQAHRDSPDRGKGGRPTWPITTPDVEGVEMRTFGELRDFRVWMANTCIHSAGRFRV